MDINNNNNNSNNSNINTTLPTITSYSKTNSHKKTVKYCKVNPGCIWVLECNCKNCKKLNL